MSFFFSLNAKISGLAWWIILIFSVHIYLDRIKLFTEGFFEIQNIFWMRAFYWPKIALFARPRQHSQWKLKKNFFFNISKNPSVKSLIFIFCLIIKNKFSKTFFSFSDFAPQKWPKLAFQHTNLVAMATVLVEMAKKIIFLLKDLRCLNCTIND